MTFANLFAAPPPPGVLTHSEAPHSRPAFLAPTVSPLLGSTVTCYLL